jgi:type IV secretion system protein TrbL
MNINIQSLCKLRPKIRQVSMLCISFIKAFLLLTFWTAAASAQTLTHYGSSADSMGDSNSLAGIGNHDNQLVALKSAALSASVAQQYHINVGDQFTYTTADGATHQATYDDTVPAAFTDPKTGQLVQEGPRIDIYDPNNVLGSANGFSAQVTSINNGATVTSPEGVTTTIPTGTTPASSAFSAQQQAISGGKALDAISSQFTSAAQQWEPVIKSHAATLFWILAAIAAAWTFAVLVMRQADLAELIGAVVRFVFITSFFWWILQHGDGFARKILQSTAQLGNESSGMDGLDYGAFANMGLQILIQVGQHVSIFQPAVGVLASLLALLILIAVGLITVNILLVVVETWVIVYAGLIFLAFGATEWSRDMSIGYYKTILAWGIKMMTTLLLAGIGLNILQGIQSQAGPGWGSDVMNLGIALLTCTILFGIIGKAPGVVAGITGVSTSGSGGHGWSSFLAGMGAAATFGGALGGVVATGGRQIGGAVRNAVKQGQALSRGRP